jgi:hypothetical protein
MFHICHSCPDFQQDKLQQESISPCDPYTWIPVYTGITEPSIDREIIRNGYAKPKIYGGHPHEWPP